MKETKEVKEVKEPKENVLNDLKNVFGTFANKIGIDKCKSQAGKMILDFDKKENSKIINDKLNIERPIHLFARGIDLAAFIIEVKPLLEKANKEIGFKNLKKFLEI